jgi:P27 family predicted phage terminase small subunit
MTAAKRIFSVVASPKLFFEDSVMPAQRKSAARKKLTGTTRADRKPRADFAIRLKRLPAPPASLTPAARRFWKYHGAAAVGVGTLSRADLPLLGLLSETLLVESEARAAVAREGCTVASASGGAKGHPAATVAATARAQAFMMMQALGLTPKARMGLDPATEPAASAPSVWDRLVATMPNVTPIRLGKRP